MATVTLSLISHTNVGKTTLARTLLRRDIGEVLDQAHVTEVSEAHELVALGDDRLMLWDTPGLGDSARLVSRLRNEHNLTMLMISHDLRVIRFTSDRVAVLYLGQVVEVADRDEIFEHALHPYTLALLEASATAQDDDAPEITAYGEPPSPVNPPPGCRFNTRCPLATDLCLTEMPPLIEVAPGHEVRCHRRTESRALLAQTEQTC